MNSDIFVDDLDDDGNSSKLDMPDLSPNGTPSQDWTPVSSAAGRRPRRKSKYLNDFYCVSTAKGGKTKIEEYELYNACNAGVFNDFTKKHCLKCGRTVPHDIDGTCQACLYKKIVASHKSRAKKAKTTINNNNNNRFDTIGESAGYYESNNITSDNNNTDSNISKSSGEFNNIGITLDLEPLSTNSISISSDTEESILQQNFKKLEDWSPIDVAKYFKSCGFEPEAELFESRDLDGSSIMLIDRRELMLTYELKLGPTLKVYERIKKLKETYRSNSNRCSKNTRD